MARRKRQQPQECGGAPEWMTTYSDLVTLLMCFFVLLFSMAVIDKQKFIEVANSLRSSFQTINSGGSMFDSNRGDVVFSVLENNNPSEVVNTFDVKKDQENSQKSNQNQTVQDAQQTAAKAKMMEEQRMDTLTKELQSAVSSLQLDQFVKVINEKSTVILRIESTVLFESGSADVKPSGYEILLKTGKLIQGLENEVFVQGHTDNMPINTDMFPSNWELSTRRATNVTVFLINSARLDPMRLTATGNGEFRPIVSNNSERNREKNRRIDIIVQKKG